MRKMRNVCALALAGCMVLALAACGGGISRKDATTYVQGELDACYRGIYNQEYIDLIEDMTEADAQEKHDYNVSAEAPFLLDFLAIEYPDDAVTAKAEDVISQIYAKAKYTVGEADKTKAGDFTVEVTVSPIEILSQLEDEVYSNNWNQALADAGIESQEQLDALSDEDYAAIDAAYGMAMLEAVEALIPELTYGKDQIVMMQLKLEDNVYSLVETGWQTLDGMMIDYNGYYVQ